MDSDPVDTTPAVPPRGIVEQVITGELHTDELARDAVYRLSVPDDEMEYWTGAVQARETADWVYGVNRRTIAPRKSGLNFSYNALYKGTGRDEEALPKFLQQRYLDETTTVVKERRARAKARSSGVPVQDTRSRAIDKSLGLVRDKQG